MSPSQLVLNRTRPQRAPASIESTRFLASAKVTTRSASTETMRATASGRRYGRPLPTLAGPRRAVNDVEKRAPVSNLNTADRRCPEATNEPPPSCAEAVPASR